MTGSLMWHTAAHGRTVQENIGSLFRLEAEATLTAGLVGTGVVEIS